MADDVHPRAQGRPRLHGAAQWAVRLQVAQARRRWQSRRVTRGCCRALLRRSAHAEDGRRKCPSRGGDSILSSNSDRACRCCADCPVRVDLKRPRPCKSIATPPAFRPRNLPTSSSRGKPLPCNYTCFCAGPQPPSLAPPECWPQRVAWWQLSFHIGPFPPLPAPSTLQDRTCHTTTSTCCTPVTSLGWRPAMASPYPYPALPHFLPAMRV